MTWRHGLAQTRASWRRLIGAAVAIALGSAFVTATLLTGSMVRHAADSLARSAIGGADLIAFPAVAEEEAVDLSLVPSATSAEISLSLDVVLRSDTGLRTSTAGNLNAAAAAEAAEGRLPEAADEVAITRVLADHLAVGIGDSILIDTMRTWSQQPTAAGYPVAMTITGIIELGTIPYVAGSQVLTTTDGLKDIAAAAGVAPAVSGVLMTTDRPGALKDELAQSGWVSNTLTREELANSLIGGYTGTSSTITNFTLAFVVIALVVSALVVSTTFQVLVAQRITVLGLLRTAGATRRQIGTSVMAEALVLGLLGGAAGVLIGHLLAALLVLVARRIEMPPDWATVLPFTPTAIIGPIIVAVVVTFASVVLPAIEASRVRPLAAVRHATTPRPRRTPILFGLILIVLGSFSAGAIAWMVRSLQQQQGYIPSMTAIVVALGTGLLAIIAGITLITPALFPRLNDLLGRAASLLAPARQRPATILARRALATNKRRATGASNALLIGVTLVAMLGTGTASARASLSAVSAGILPTDVVLDTWDPDSLAITPELVDQIRQIPGVSAAAAMASFQVTVTSGQVSVETGVIGVDPAELAKVTYDPALGPGITDGVLATNMSLPYQDGTRVTVASTIWPSTPPPNEPVTPTYGEPVPFTILTVQSEQWESFITMNSARQLMDDPPITRVWIAAPGADLEVITQEVERLATVTDEFGNPLTSVYAPGMERQGMDDTISTAVTLAASLLAVSILIALLGVANTLSLSVLERRREFAMLRAVGMTSRQLRFSLALEGLIMALSAAAVGIVIGVCFGIAGSSVLFPDGTNHLVVPWPLMAGIVGVACAAGPLAAILPGRIATRGSPVAGFTS